MFNKLKKYSNVIIIVVAVAMVLTGVLYGVGSFGDSSAYAVATVNGADITSDQYYSALYNQLGSNYISRDQEFPFKYNVLNSIINTELLLQEADRMKIKSQITEEDLDDYIALLLENNQMTEEELEEQLKNSNSSLKEFRQQVRNVLDDNDRLAQVIERSYGDITITDEEIARQFEEVEIELIRKEKENEDAREEIEKARQRVESGEEFALVAEEMSDFHLVNPGRLTRDIYYLPNNLVETALTLEIGEISEILDEEDAYYLIKLVDKKLAVGEEYEAAREEIRNDLLARKQDEVFSNWFADLRNRSKIVINDPSLSGYEALVNGDYDTAIKDLKKALEAYQAPMLYVYLAEAYFGLEDNDKADKTMKEAIELNPEDWELHYFYAMLKAGTESSQEDIVALLDKASELAGDNITAHYQLFLAYSQLDEQEKAEIELEKIEEIQTMFMELQEALEANEAETDELTDIDENNEE
mgnify:FL=1